MIMKIGLLATWKNYVSNLMCCFSCFNVCFCLCWGWTNGAMWCCCFTKWRIIVCNWRLRRRPELLSKWWLIFRFFHCMSSSFLYKMNHKMYIWSQRERKQEPDSTERKKAVQYEWKKYSKLLLSTGQAYRNFKIGTELLEKKILPASSATSYCLQWSQLRQNTDTGFEGRSQL